MTTVVTAKPTTPASAAPTPHYTDIPKTDAYALPLDISAIELDQQPGADAHMHGIGEDFLSTSAPNAQHANDASTQSTELPCLSQGTAAHRRPIACHLGGRYGRRP